MKKYALTVVLLSLITSKIFACALCTLYDPSVKVYTDINIWQNKIDSIAVKWEFSKTFTNETLKVYDFNQNGVLDKEELEELKNVYDISLEESGYFMHLKLQDSLPLTPQEIVSNVNNRRLWLEDSRLFYSFILVKSMILKSEMLINLAFEDSDGYFSFSISPQDVKVRSDENWRIANESNFYGANAFLILTKNSSVKALAPLPVQDEKNDLLQESMYKAAEILNELFTSLKQKLSNVNQDGSIGAWATLLLFSYLYGAFHALGPGHGKLLTASYFINGKRLYKDALKSSALIGITHTVSAFIITLIGFLVAKEIASLEVKSEYIITLVGGIVIVFIALLLLYKKLFSEQTHEAQCSCSACNAKKYDIWMMLSIGAPPCPGVILVFTVMFTIGGVMSGLLSALFISLGMASVIALFALGAIRLKKGATHRVQKYMHYIELASIFVVLALGAIMSAGAITTILFKN